MEYRIKEEQIGDFKYFYPQWKKRWFWRRFTYPTGEDGTVMRTKFYRDIEDAKETIEQDKVYRVLKATAKPKQTIYHYID